MVRLTRDEIDKIIKRLDEVMGNELYTENFGGIVYIAGTSDVRDKMKDYLIKMFNCDIRGEKDEKI
jgi:hypothetical protein